MKTPHEIAKGSQHFSNFHFHEFSCKKKYSQLSLFEATNGRSAVFDSKLLCLAATSKILEFKSLSEIAIQIRESATLCCLSLLVCS